MASVVQLFVIAAGLLLIDALGEFIFRARTYPT
jgi:hypothetical protein